MVIIDKILLVCIILWAMFCAFVILGIEWIKNNKNEKKEQRKRRSKVRCVICGKVKNPERTWTFFNVDVTLKLHIICLIEAMKKLKKKKII